MRMVVALGGNALLKRGEPMTAEVQRGNVKLAAQALAPLARQHQVIISHGNGPQVGLLALQAAAYPEVEAYPLDVLGAQTEGMIGYLIEQELRNVLPLDRPIATLLTLVEVDPHDPAFQNPSKFVGPVYDEPEAKQLAAAKGWVVKPDGDTWRRVVPSPMPRRICPQSRLLRHTTPQELEASTFPAGSMGPKVTAACWFVRQTGQRAAIGALADLAKLVTGEAGTQVVAPHKA